MIIKLTSKELESIEIKHVEKAQYSQKYLSERENVWNKQKSIHGEKLWNGILYTIEFFLQTKSKIILFMGTCEYKDVIMQRVIPLQRIIKKQGYKALSKYISIDCIPITLDKKLLFGKRSEDSSLKNKKGLIGGSLNKDEMEVNSFKDLKNFALKEIKEETKFAPNQQDLRLVSLNHYACKYQFLFTFQTNINSLDLDKYYKEGEFSKLIALTSREYRNKSINSLLAYEYCKDLADDIIEINN